MTKYVTMVVVVVVAAAVVANRSPVLDMVHICVPARIMPSSGVSVSSFSCDKCPSVRCTCAANAVSNC